MKLKEKIFLTNFRTFSFGGRKNKEKLSDKIGNLSKKVYFWDFVQQAGGDAWYPKAWSTEGCVQEG